MNYYQSKDFYCSAFLIANGFELADHRRERGFTLFFFEESAELNQLVKQFYSLAATIEPIKYSQSLRALKGVIHSTLSTSTSDRGSNNEFNNNKKGNK